MNHSGIIEQLLKGDLGTASLGLLLAFVILTWFTVNTIYRFFVKEALAPIAQYLTFLSAQGLMGIINRLLINWGKNRDNKAKIASVKEQLRLDPDSLMLHKKLAWLYVESKDQRLNAIKHYAYVFENNPTDREAFNHLLNDALKRREFKQSQSLIDIAEFGDRNIMQLTFDALMKHNQKLDHKLETANHYLKNRLIKVREAYIDIIRYSLSLTSDFQMKVFSNMAHYLSEYSETFTNLACSYEKLALYPEAINNYRLSLGFFTSAETASRLGLLLLNHSNQYEEAKTCYEKLIELNPNYAAAHNNLGNLLINHFNQYEEAKTCYEKAIKLDPSCAGFQYHLGSLLERHLNQHEEAKACYEKAIELDPNCADFRCGLGSFLKGHTNQHEEAKACYEKAIELDPNHASTYNDLGGLLTDNLSQHETAKAYFDKAIELVPDNAIFHANRGHTVKRLNQFEAAKECYEKAIELDPKNSSYHDDLGCLLAHHFSQYKAAKECYEKAIELDPNYADSHRHLGDLLTHYFSQHDAAKGCYEKAIDLDQNNAMSHNGLGSLLSDYLNQHKAAKVCFGKAIKIAPNDAIFHTNLGHATYRSNEFEAAKVCYEKAIGLDPGDASAYLGLGNLLDRHFYEPVLVVACYLKVLELAPGTSQASKLRAIIGEYEPLINESLNGSFSSAP